MPNELLEAIAFALFARQCEDWDLPEAAARMEWESDPEIKRFWVDQAKLVDDVIGRWKQGPWCAGCGRRYSIPGFLRETDIGCHESYAATGETPQQAWCAETGKKV